MPEWLVSIGHDPDTHAYHSCATCRADEATEDAIVDQLFTPSK